MKKFFLGGFLVVAAAGCGGDHPLDMFSSGGEVPELTYPFGTAVAPTAFSASTPYYQWGAGTQSILSPGKGMVTRAGTVSGELGVGVEVVHNGRVRSVVSGDSGFFSIAVRAGDKVERGQLIGSTQAGNIRLSVYLDGSRECPYFFFRGTDRAVAANTCN